jgi:uncharacterized protein YfdQ (DUF2303 family)
VWAEQWRWRRGNLAAARLVYFEVIYNLTVLGTLAKVTSEALVSRLSRATWDAQGVQVASLLTGRRLNTVAAAYFRMAGLINMHAVAPTKDWVEWIEKSDGKESLGRTIDALEKAETILKSATAPTPGWLDAAVTAAKTVTARAPWPGRPSRSE